MEDLRARLARGEALVGDGALGTLVMERGLPPSRPPEWLVLEKPEALVEVARLYVEAGADLVTTDTFGASRLRLAMHGLAGDVERINRRAVECVREAVGGRVYVSASVGPTGRLLAPLGDTEPAEAEAGFAEQAVALAAAGADLFCVETMTDLVEATCAVRAARAAAPRLPVMATMTFERTPRGFFTVMGVPVERAMRGLAEAGADVVGANCGAGGAEMLDLAREILRHARRPVIVQPNAGLPVTRDGRTVYPETPDTLAGHAREMLGLGVAIVGGCCGTTPDHVRALRAVVDRRRARAGPVTGER